MTMEQQQSDWNARSGTFSSYYVNPPSFCSAHAVSNPVMIPQGASPRSVGDQSGIYHQMIEEVLNSPGIGEFINLFG